MKKAPKIPGMSTASEFRRCVAKMTTAIAKKSGAVLRWCGVEARSGCYRATMR